MNIENRRLIQGKNKMSTSKKLGVRESLIIDLIVGLSVVVPIAVAVLILFPDMFRVDFGIEAGVLPLFHAILNGSTGLLLILGLYFIKQRRIVSHKRVMLLAFSFSTIFLVSYVISKLNTEPTPFGGEGILKGIYYFILISHIILSVPVLPLAMFSIFRGLTRENEKHKKLVRYTFPIWLYVSFTGVLVYIFMAPYY